MRNKITFHDSNKTDEGGQYFLATQYAVGKAQLTKKGSSYVCHYNNNNISFS